MNSTRPLLLIGEGHGFHSLLRGCSASSLDASVYSDDQDSLRLGLTLGFQAAEGIDDWLRVNQRGMVVSSGYRQKVPNEYLSRATFLNIHYAAFPKYRGMHSIVWALLNGDTSIGVTLHIMTQDFDAGPILWQRRLRVKRRTSWQLMLMCDDMIEEKIGKVLRRILSGTVKSRKQNEKCATFVTKRNLEDCEIDWKTWDCKLFGRHLRALVEPYPLPYFWWKGRRFEILSASLRRAKYFETPGHVVYVQGQSIFVKLVDGLLQVHLLKNAETGEVMPASQLFPAPGARLVHSEARSTECRTSSQIKGS